MDRFPPPDDDHAYICFKDVSWLQTFGLDANNALDYFSLSQFFDRSCNNQVVRMQLQFTAGGSQYTSESISSRLRLMTGVEYEVARSLPPRLFIIHKQRRYSPTQVTVLASYYILNGTIYNCPTLYSVVSQRVISSLHHLNSAVQYANQWLEFDPTKSRYSIKTDEETDKAMDEENDNTADEDMNVKTSGDSHNKINKTNSSLDGVHKDKIDFVTMINAKFMQLP